MASSFFISFMLVFILLLLNMFIAIIYAHYTELQKDTKGNEEDIRGFFKVILDIIRLRMSKGKNFRQGNTKCCNFLYPQQIDE
jgi:hypothetical protein